MSKTVNLVPAGIAALLHPEEGAKLDGKYISAFGMYLMEKTEDSELYPCPDFALLSGETLEDLEEQAISMIREQFELARQALKKAGQ